MSINIFIVRVRFCNWFCEVMCNGEVNDFLTRFKDEFTYTVM
jgi:hypothetical protein